eukprot:COSAG02_NODE_46319_length_350_cov_0.569721_1_plen_93_part_10
MYRTTAQCPTLPVRSLHPAILQIAETAPPVEFTNQPFTCARRARHFGDVSRTVCHCPLLPSVQRSHPDSARPDVGPASERMLLGLDSQVARPS